MSGKRTKIQRKKKIRLFMIIALSAVILVFHGLWVYNRFVKFESYGKAVGYDEYNESYYGYDEKATYDVVLPSYPSFDGYMSVSYSADEEYYVSVYIYPKLLGGCECRFVCKQREGNEKVEVWFDEEFNYIEKYESVGEISGYENQLLEICEVIYDKWGILKYDKE